MITSGGKPASEAIAYMNWLGQQKTPFLFIIDFEMKSPFVFPLDKINPEEILFSLNGISNSPARTSEPEKFFLKKKIVPYTTYVEAFDKVKQHIQAGNTYLLNLTFQTPVETNLTFKDIFHRSSAKYKLLFRDRFVVFSPEIFVQICGNRISSFPMKGTIDAAIENAEKIILSDPKETAEHYTIVDLIRNDLSMVAKNVRVERFRYVEKIHTTEKNLLQVSSEISGDLPEGWQANAGSIIFSLLPAGSISGAPKKKTTEIILESENYKREYYTGIVGLFDGKNLDSGVMIRFIENTPDGLVFKSGGGITSFSQPELEYAELGDKVYFSFI